MEENIYIVLNLDPNIRDNASIESAFNALRLQLNKQLNHPSKGQQAKQTLSKLEGYKKQLLDDPNFRNEEAERAKKITAKRAKEKYANFDKNINFITPTGTITKEKLVKFLKKFPGITIDEVKKRYKNKIEIIEKEAPKKKAKVQALEGSLFKKINTNLEIIKKKDLYDFLELGRGSTLSTLTQKASKIYTDSNNNANKTPTVTAQSELAGAATSVFKDEATRASYNRSVDDLKFESIKELMMLNAGTKAIDPDQYEMLLKEGAKQGLHVEDVKEYVQDFCDSKKWHLLTIGSTIEDDTIQCGNCGSLENKNTKVCTNCSLPLYLNCPNCNTQNQSKNYACQSCGFQIGDMANALPLIKAAKKKFAENKLQQANDLLKQAKLFWAKNPDVIELDRQINGELSRIKTFLDEIKALQTKKHYYAIKSQILAADELTAKNPETLSILTIADRKIRQAEQYVQQAKTHSDENQKLDLYLSTLEEAADSRDALDALATIPPAPPTRLSYQTSEKIISLKWQASTSKRGVKYKIIRKIGSSPASVADGEELHEVPLCQYDDSTATAGVTYFYAVFAVRGAIPSEKYEAAGPALRVENIAELQCLSGDNRVNLTWKSPEKAIGTEVWRKQGSIPTKRENGQLMTNNLNNLIDTNVQNGVTYGYLVVSVFADLNNNKYYARGISQQVSPAAPPKPVVLNTLKENDTIKFTWQKPAKGDVQIIKSGEKPSIKSGDELPLNQITQIGDTIPVTTAISTNYKIDFQGLAYFTPFTVHNQLAVAGDPILFTSLDDITNLKGLITGGKLYLEWNWTSGIEKVKVAYSHDRFPKDSVSQRNATALTFTKKDYEKNTGFILHNIEKKDYYFTVYAISEQGGQTLQSTGVNYLISNSKEFGIKYTIKINKTLFGKIKSAYLELELEEDKPFPDLSLITNIGNVPFQKEGGQEIMTISHTHCSFPKTEFEIFERYLGKNKYVKLFFTDNASAGNVRLYAPNKEKLKLF